MATTKSRAKNPKKKKIFYTLSSVCYVCSVISCFRLSPLNVSIFHCGTHTQCDPKYMEMPHPTWLLHAAWLLSIPFDFKRTQTTTHSFDLLDLRVDFSHGMLINNVRISKSFIWRFLTETRLLLRPSVAREKNELTNEKIS